MTKSVSRFLALSLMLALASLMFSMPAQAEAIVVMTNETTPLTITVKPCSTTELVTLSGTLHRLVMVSQTPSGHRTFHHLTKQEVSGVSSTGVQYHGSGSNVGAVTLQDDNNVTVHDSVSYRIIVGGRGDNLMIHVTTHFTFNEDGTIKSSHDYFSSECR